MKDKKVIILIVLGVIAAVSLFYGMFTPTKGRQNIIRQQASAPQGSTAATEKGAVRLNRDAKKTAYSSWARDPFSAYSGPIKGYAGLTLNGIMWDERKPMAIINDSIVKIGDEVNGNKVIGIRQDRAILNDGTKDFELILGR